MITGIIMAAGLSRRMGVNKLLLCIDDTPLILRTLKIVESSRIQKLIVVYSDERVLEVLQNYKQARSDDEACNTEIQLVYNQHPERGQSESVKLGMYEAEKSCSGYMFFVADQPFLSSAVIDTLTERFLQSPNHIIVPTYNGNRGMPILFPKQFRLDLMGVSGDKGGRSIIDQNIPQTIFVPIQDTMAGKDMDTMKDYEEACKTDLYDKDE